MSSIFWFLYTALIIIDLLIIYFNKFVDIFNMFILDGLGLLYYRSNNYINTTDLH